MGQKVNPHGLRVGIIKDWDSRWFADKKSFGDSLVEDYNLRVFLKKKLFQAGVARIEIEKFANKIRIFIHAAKPGIVIGKGGAEIEKLKKELEKMTGKTIILNVIEVKVPDMSAQLVAENIASQLERPYLVQKGYEAVHGQNHEDGAKGIKTQVAGRVGGAEIARTEQYHEGTIPLQTLRADIDYGFTEANTTYGKLGVKVWIYKGEILADNKSATTRETTPRRRPEGRRSDAPKRQQRGGRK